MIARLDETEQQLTRRNEWETKPRSAADRQSLPITKRTNNDDPGMMWGNVWHLTEDYSYDLFDLQDSGLVPT
jgi:hypothetical protein